MKHIQPRLQDSSSHPHPILLPELGQLVSVGTPTAEDVTKATSVVLSVLLVLGNLLTDLQDEHIERARDFLRAKQHREEADGPNTIVLGAEQAFGSASVSHSETSRTIRGNGVHKLFLAFPNRVREDPGGHFLEVVGIAENTVRISATDAVQRKARGLRSAHLFQGKQHDDVSGEE